MDNQQAGPPLTSSRRTRSLAGHSEVSLRSVFSLPVSNINIEAKSSQSTLSKCSFGDDSGRMSLNPRHLARKLSLFKPQKQSLREILRNTEWTNRTSISNTYEAEPVVKVLDKERVKKLVAAIFLFIAILGTIIGITTTKSRNQNKNLTRGSNSTSEFNFTLPNIHPNRTHINRDSSPVDADTNIPSAILHRTIHPTSIPGKGSNLSNTSLKPSFVKPFPNKPSIIDTIKFNETDESSENTTIKKLPKALPLQPSLNMSTQFPTLPSLVSPNETIDPLPEKPIQNPTLHPSKSQTEAIEPLSGEPSQNPTLYSSNLSYGSIQPSLRETSQALTFHPSIFSNNTKRPAASSLSLTFSSVKDTSKPTNIVRPLAQSKTLDSPSSQNSSRTPSLSNPQISNYAFNNSNASKPPHSSQSPSVPKNLISSNSSETPSLINAIASPFSISPSLTPSTIKSSTYFNNSEGTKFLSLSPTLASSITDFPSANTTVVESPASFNNSEGTKFLSLSPTLASSITDFPSADTTVVESPASFNNSEGTKFLSLSPTLVSSTADFPSANTTVVELSSVPYSFVPKLSSIPSSLPGQTTLIPVTTPPSLNLTTQPSAAPIPRWAQIGGDIYGSQDLERIGELTSISRKSTNSSIQTRIAIATSLNEYEYDTNFGKSLYPGVVQVFELQESKGGSSWSQLGSVFSGEKNFGLGSSMILSGDGNTLVLGSKGNFETSLKSYTAIFRYNSSLFDVWEKIGNFESQEKNEVLSISNSITYDGNRLLLGMASYTQNGGEKLIIATFDFVKKNNWNLIGAPLVFDSSPSVPTDRNRSRIPKQKLILCTAMSREGHRFAISAYGRYYTFAQVREFDERTSVWKPLMDPIPSRPGDISLSGDGQVFAIGIPNATPSKGQVRVYMVKRKGVWFQLGENFSSPTKDINNSDFQCQLLSDNFGHSISLSFTGYRIAIGSPIQCGSLSLGVGNTGFHGKVFLYDYASESQKWKLVEEEIGTNNTSDSGLFRGKENGDRFGHSVSLSEDGEMMIISAITSNSKGRERGKVQVYAYG